MAEEKKTINIMKCARCGGEHKHLPFKVFKNPIGRYTQRATCPVTKKRILIRPVV